MCEGYGRGLNCFCNGPAVAILAALFLGAAGLLLFGADGAVWLSSLYGSNSGGTEMSIVFTLGPLGGLTGILLGVGLMFHDSGGPAGCGPVTSWIVTGLV